MKKLTYKNLHTLNDTYETSLYSRTKLTIKEPVKKPGRCPIKTGTVTAVCDVGRSKGHLKSSSPRPCQTWHVLLQPSADIFNYLLTDWLTDLFNYLLTYLLPSLFTPCSTDLLEKLAGSQLVKKLGAFYETRRFITAFTSACHLSLS